MKKLVVSILVICLLIVTGCYNSEDAPQKDSLSSITFTDALNRKVTVDKPKRVATLLGSFADVWYLAGGEVVSGPDDMWNDFDLPLKDDVINLGGTKNPSLDLLFKSNPDFVIASTKTKAHMEWKETLEHAKINVAYFDVANFNDYLNMLKICTDITGKKDLYKTNGLDIKAIIDTTIEKSKQRLQNSQMPKVLSLRASSASIRAKNSKGNVLGEMLKDLGCNNIADTNNAFLENLNMEYIIEQDPDLIFFVQIGDNKAGMQAKIEQFIKENPAWHDLKAVKNNHVFMMDKMLYNMKPNSRWGEAYEKLEKLIEDNIL